MAKMTILGIVEKIYPIKRTSALIKIRFVRIIEEKTRSVFDVKFYNNKADQINDNGIEEGQKVIVETYVVGNHWENVESGKEGIFVNINGQSISNFNFDIEKPKIVE